MDTQGRGRGRGRGAFTGDAQPSVAGYAPAPAPAAAPVAAPVAAAPAAAGRGRGRGRGGPAPASSSTESLASSLHYDSSSSSVGLGLSSSSLSLSSSSAALPRDQSSGFTAGLGLGLGLGISASGSSGSLASSSNFWAQKTGSANRQSAPQGFGGSQKPAERFSNAEEGGDHKERSKEEDDERHLRTVFLGDISPQSTIESIKAAFAEFGDVFVKIPTDKETGERKGMAFVEFPDMLTAAHILEKREMLLDGTYVRLDAAKPKKKEAPENFKYASSAQRWELPEEGQKASAKDENLEKSLFTGVNSGINFDKYDNIQCEVTGENVPPGVPIKQFADANLDPLLIENINLAGYTKPTPVQKYAIPIGLAKRDIMACAQTGSGKTAAFLFPSLSQLMSRGPYKGPLPEISSDRPSEFKTAFPEMVIMAPTRELASQIFEETCKFSYRSFIRPCAVYGGADIGSQQYELEKGCTILVATPGRMVAMINRGSLHLGLCNSLVLDEADRMLDMGFEKQIRELLEDKGMPPKGVRHTMMFSATFPDSIQQLAADFLHDYLFITVGRVGSTSENITQKVVFVEERNKEEELVKCLTEFLPQGLTLVFLKSKRTADALDHSLRKQGFGCCTIHGDLVQWEREEAIRLFKSGELPILIATDVASRGLDIPAVMNVINYDLPKEIDDYVHRIGRTGRVGRTGVATSFVNHYNWGVAPALVDFLRASNQECPDWLERIAKGERSSDRGGRRFEGGGERRGGFGGDRRGGGGRGGFGGRDRRYQKEPEGYAGDNDYSNLGSEKEGRGGRGRKEKEGAGGSQEMKAWDRMALREKRLASEKVVYASSTVIWWPSPWPATT